MTQPPTIDHDKNEFGKVPNYGDREAFRRQNGREPKPVDFWNMVIPLTFFWLAIYAWRHWF